MAGFARRRRRGGAIHAYGAPHSIEAEQALLGAILINNEAFGLVSRLIEPEDFFEPIHKKIYSVAGNLISAGKLATPVTLKNYLPADLDIAGISLNRYLARLCAEATTVINAPDYAKVICDLAHRRTMMAIGEELQAIAAGSPVDFSPDMLAQQTIERLDEIVMAHNRNACCPRRDRRCRRTGGSTDAAVVERGGKIGGITTGLKTLDNLTEACIAESLCCRLDAQGWARAASCVRALKTADGRIQWFNFSLEMGSVSLGSRAISDLLFDPRDPVPYWKIVRGELADNQAQTVVDAARDLRNLPLVIDPQPSLTFRKSQHELASMPAR